MAKNIALYEALGYHETARQDVGGRNVVHMAKNFGVASPDELRAEALAVAADADDRAEAAAVLRFMEDLR